MKNGENWQYCYNIVIFYGRVKIRVTTLTRWHDDAAVRKRERSAGIRAATSCQLSFFIIGITLVNCDERDGERHLAVSLHPLGIPVTGSLPPLPVWNHRTKGRTPSTLFVQCRPWPRVPCIYIPTLSLSLTQTRTLELFHMGQTQIFLSQS